MEDGVPTALTDTQTEVSKPERTLRDLRRGGGGRSSSSRGGSWGSRSSYSSRSSYGSRYYSGTSYYTGGFRRSYYYNGVHVYYSYGEECRVDDLGCQKEGKTYNTVSTIVWIALFLCCCGCGTVVKACKQGCKNCCNFSVKKREGARDEVEELEKHEKEQEEMEENKRRRSVVEPAYEEPLGIQRQQTLSKGTYEPIIGG